MPPFTRVPARAIPVDIFELIESMVVSRLPKSPQWVDEIKLVGPLAYQRNAIGRSLECPGDC